MAGFQEGSVMGKEGKWAWSRKDRRRWAIPRGEMCGSRKEKGCVGEWEWDHGETDQTRGLGVSECQSRVDPGRL